MLRIYGRQGGVELTKGLMNRDLRVGDLSSDYRVISFTGT